MLVLLVKLIGKVACFNAHACVEGWKEDGEVMGSRKGTVGDLLSLYRLSVLELRLP